MRARAGHGHTALRSMAIIFWQAELYPASSGQRLTISRCDWADTPLDGVFDHLMPAPLASGDHDLTEREKLPWMVVALETFVETLLDLFKPRHTKRSAPERVGSSRRSAHVAIAGLRSQRMDVTALSSVLIALDIVFLLSLLLSTSMVGRPTPRCFAPR
jgi:hypothetical protein